MRLEARPKKVKRTGTWMWDDNPFKGTRELQGLKIMMALINNWDMKDDNNQILASRGETTGGELRYIVIRRPIKAASEGRAGRPVSIFLAVSTPRMATLSRFIVFL